jgi:hypothetical protein
VGGFFTQVKNLRNLGIEGLGDYGIMVLRIAY